RASATKSWWILWWLSKSTKTVRAYAPPPELIKVNGKPVSGSSNYDLNTIPLTFADLTGSALGQTNATGITLDSNAAG
ncbi:MAG: hypothetical protein KJ899_13535, partial [Gammaproteobacteria bacterium]|nr:hypothetical protein [Gammaproteobacteria bacterium]